MPSLFKVGTGWKQQVWIRETKDGSVLGGRREAGQSCSPGHFMGDGLNSEFLSLCKNINNIKIQQSWCCRNFFPKAPVTGALQLCVLSAAAADLLRII